MGKTKDKDLWIATAILVINIAAMRVIILNFVRIGFFVGPFRLNHWFVWIGTIYIAFAVPVIARLKKRHPQQYGRLVKTHIFGNLLAFMLISLHFASQISRPAEAYPDLGTGLVLYAAMVLLVSTGFLQRFRLTPSVKLGHIGSCTWAPLSRSI